jgi:protein O-mannosyl-transferase
VLNPSSVHAYYLPLSMTSLMVDYALGGRPANPVIFHRTNLALHVVNALLVLLIVQRLFGSLVAAAVVALLFGLHPLGVEPIASIGERKTLLATALALASILTYLRSLTGAQRWRVASVALFLLALLAKPSVIAVPALLLLLDAWPLGRLSWRTAGEKWPWFALSLLSAVVTVLSVARTWDFGPLPKSDMVQSLLRVAHVLTFYLGKIIWPARLSPVYQPPDPFTLRSPAVALAAFVVPAVTALTVIARRRTRAPIVGWMMFVVALAPTFGILTWSTIITYDRYVYFPALGLLLVAGASLASVWSARATRGTTVRAVSIVLAGLVLAAEARATRATLHNWRDSMTLWQQIARVAPRMPESHNGLGTVLDARGEPDAALAEYRRAIALDPGYMYAHLNLGNSLLERGDLMEAIGHLRAACAGLPGDPQAARAYGFALMQAGLLAESEAELQRAVELRPGYVAAMSQLGVVMAMRGRVDEGTALLERAIARAPGDARPRFWLAISLLQANGREREALLQLEQAIRLDPGWPVPPNQLAWLLATLPDPALRDAERARQLAARAVALTHGRDAGMLDTEAAAEAAAGRFDAAVRMAGEALRIASTTRGDGARALAGAIRARIARYAQRTIYTEAPRDQRPRRPGDERPVISARAGS